MKGEVGWQEMDGIGDGVGRVSEIREVAIGGEMSAEAVM